MNDLTDASCRDFRAKVHLLSRLVLDLGRVPEESAHACKSVLKRSDSLNATKNVFFTDH